MWKGEPSPPDLYSLLKTNKQKKTTTKKPQVCPLHIRMFAKKKKILLLIFPMCLGQQAAYKNKIE